MTRTEKHALDRLRLKIALKTLKDIKRIADNGSRYTSVTGTIFIRARDTINAIEREVID